MKMEQNKSAAIKESHSSSALTNNTTLQENELCSTENIDRSSPELWPALFPGVSEFVPLRRDDDIPPTWNAPLNSDDMLMIQQLSNMPTTTLIMEVKKLHDLAYKLGVDEAKEMTRGMYLNIFNKNSNK